MQENSAKENINDDSINAELDIKDEFEESDIPIIDDDFYIPANADVNEKNHSLAKLAFVLPERKAQNPAPEGSKLVHRGTIQHYQCLKGENLYKRRKNVVNHLKQGKGKLKAATESGEVTENPLPKQG